MTLEGKQKQHIANLRLALDNTEELYTKFLGNDISIVGADTTKPFITISFDDKSKMGKFVDKFPPNSPYKIKHGDNVYHVNYKMHKEVYKRGEDDVTVNTRMEYIHDGLMVWVKFPMNWWNDKTYQYKDPTPISWAGYGKTTYHSFSTSEGNAYIFNNLEL